MMRSAVVSLVGLMMTPVSPVVAQEPLFVAIVARDEQVLVPIFRYQGGSWRSLQFGGMAADARTDTLRAIAQALPSEWFIAGGLPFDTIRVGAASAQLNLPIAALSADAFFPGGTALAFSRPDVPASAFYDIRSNVIKWSRLSALLGPVLDSLEVAWVTSVDPASRLPIPPDASVRHAESAVFTSMLESGEYIWYNLERVYPRHPDHSDPRCWDRSVLTGWAVNAPTSGVGAQLPWNFSPVRMQEGFRVTDCDDKGHGFFRPTMTFQHDNGLYVLIMRSEYDSDEGPEHVIYVHRSSTLQELIAF
jgi:hypothetical protein